MRLSGLRAARAAGCGGALAVLASAAACGGASAAMAGRLDATGGELGSAVFTPDSCKARDDGALDLLDSTHPGLVLRVVHPGLTPVQLVLANQAAGREAPLTASANCTIHEGYQSITYGDRGIGLRVDCTTPAGGQVHGVVGAGVCR
jgi:hypothetical protein